MDNHPTYFAIIPASVRYDNSIPMGAKMMYGEITALSNVKGYCFASNGYFAKLYGVTNQAISKWIKQLEKAGHVAIEYTGDTWNQQRRVSIVVDTYQHGLRGVSTPVEHNITSSNIYVDEQNSEFGSDDLTGASCATHRNDQQIETQPHPLPPPRDKKKKGKYETQVCRDDYEKYKSMIKVNFPNLYSSKVKILTHEQYSIWKAMKDLTANSSSPEYVSIFIDAHKTLNQEAASRQKFTSVIALYDSSLGNQGLLTLSKIIDHERTTGELPTSYRVDKSPYSVV